MTDGQLNLGMIFGLAAALILGAVLLIAAAVLSLGRLRGRRMARTHPSMPPEGGVRIIGCSTGTLSAQAVRKVVDSQDLRIEDADAKSLIRFDTPPRVAAFSLNGRPMLGMSNLGDATSSAIEARTGLTHVRDWSSDSDSGDRAHCFTGDREAVDRAWGYMWWQIARSREADRVSER